MPNTRYERVPFGEITRNGYNYGSIVRAIERLILMRSSVLPHQYPASFEGITRALWDLGTVLSGTIPPPAISTIGTQPPGWDTANGTYFPGAQPADGSFWFDARCGRLFVSENGEWYQTNGGEAYAHIGTQPPPRQVPGAFWYNTTSQTMLVFLDAATTGGQEGWYPVTTATNPGGLTPVSMGMLSDFHSSPVVRDIPAASQEGVVLRDGRVHDGSDGAYKLTDRLDLGSYALIAGLSAFVWHVLQGVQAV